MLICKKCSSEVSEIEEKCSTCGWNAGPPNVRSAARRKEVDALEERYVAAIEQAKIDGREAPVMSFDEDMRATCAVVNVDLKFLHQFITDDKPTYANYELSRRGQTRKPAKVTDDRRRRTQGSMLFGDYAEQIRYAALSLDEGGLGSYGPYSMKIREVAIEERATLLEDNSYDFIPKHQMRPGDDVPLGYVSTWKERHKLAVAKLSNRLSASTTKAEHPKILLSGNGNRQTDEYEVHIYGGFDNKAIESVKGSSSVKSKYDQAALSAVKDYLKKDGKLWREE